jgi:tRNA-specific 2-thiouridylase
VPRLGLPHVTLDLREEFRRAVVEPFVRGYARGETPNPCIRCNGSFRFAELLAFARRAARAARDRALRAHRRARRPLLLARGADRRRTRATCSRGSTRAPRPLSFPLGEQTKDETRAEARRGGSPRPPR